MAKLMIIIEMDADPTLVDPHDIANEMLDHYENSRDKDDPAASDFASAEWING